MVRDIFCIILVGLAYLVGKDTGYNQALYEQIISSQIIIEKGEAYESVPSPQKQMYDYQKKRFYM